MTDSLEIDRLAEAVAWLKSGEAMMGPRTEAAVSVVLDRLASMIPAGGLAEEARDAARYRHLTDVHGPRSELCFDGDVCAGRAEFDAMIDASIAALSAPTPQQEP